MSRSFENVCPHNCYSTCRIKTFVEGDKITRIVGDKKSPFTSGALCPKGYSFIHTQSSPNRLLYPMKQQVKGSGNWERITWDRALTEIAARLIRIKNEEKNMLPVSYSKHAGNIGLLSNTVDVFFQSIGYITLMAGSPCNSSGLDAFLLSYGACKKPHPADMENSKLIFIWGSNPAWTLPHQMKYAFEAKKRGGKIVVIDPLFSATAARADLYIQLKPGSDGTLANGIAKILLDEKLIDYDFLREHTNGWEQYLSYLNQLNMTLVAQCTGVPLQTIHELAMLLGSAKPATIWLGIGAQHNTTGGQNFRAINALAAISGNIGIPGGNVHYTTTDLKGLFSLDKICSPPPDSIGVLNENGAFQHRMIRTGRFAEIQYLSPSLRFLWIAGRNPVAQDPDSNVSRQVLKSLETVVVADTYLTESALNADYVLPVTTFFEQEDIVVSKWHFSIALNEQAIPPTGESKSDFWIMRKLARILNKLSPGFSTFPTAWTHERWLDTLMRDKCYDRLGINNYRDLAGKYFAIDLPAVPWSDRIFSTPSGKFEFAATDADDFIRALHPTGKTASYSPYSLQLMSIRSCMTLNSQFRDVFSQLAPEENCIMINPKLAYGINIETGDKVRVYNDLGEIHFPAVVTPSVPPDIVGVYVASVSTDEKELNTLVILQETDLGKISWEAPGIAFKDCFVNISKGRLT